MVIYAVGSMKRTTEEKVGRSVKDSQLRRLRVGEQRECDERAKRTTVWGVKTSNLLAVLFAPLVSAPSSLVLRTGQRTQIGGGSADNLKHLHNYVD